MSNGNRSFELTFVLSIAILPQWHGDIGADEWILFWSIAAIVGYGGRHNWSW